MSKTSLMKTQIILLSIAFMAFSSPEKVQTLATADKGSANISKPQSVDFAFFRTHRQGKGATASWGLNYNEGTGGFMVQRTYEDPNDPYAFWEDLNYLPCTSARSFKWTDENVFPGIISYRIVAHLYDGTSVSSPVSQVRIVRH
jgi:hypothetical protein